MGSEDVISLLKENKWMEVKQIAKQLDQQSNTINRIVKELSDRNEIHKRKVKKSYLQKPVGYQKEHIRNFSVFEYHWKESEAKE